MQAKKRPAKQSDAAATAQSDMANAAAAENKRFAVKAKVAATTAATAAANKAKNTTRSGGRVGPT
jgi:hypothetical protein